VGNEAALFFNHGEAMKLKVKGLTLIEMMLAYALAMMLLMAVIGFLLAIKKLHHRALILFDFDQRGQLITQLLYQDLVKADPSSVVFSKNNIIIKLNRKYHGKQQIVMQSLYVDRGSLFEKINDDRSEALIPDIASLSARYDTKSDKKGVMIKIKVHSKYTRKSRLWFVYFTLSEQR
jgi:hypothetical protein